MEKPSTEKLLNLFKAHDQLAITHYSFSNGPRKLLSLLQAPLPKPEEMWGKEQGVKGDYGSE